MTINLHHENIKELLQYSIHRVNKVIGNKDFYARKQLDNTINKLEKTLGEMT